MNHPMRVVANQLAKTIEAKPKANFVKPAAPVFADRAERDAYYRARYNERHGVNEDEPVQTIDAGYSSPLLDDDDDDDDYATVRVPKSMESWMLLGVGLFKIAGTIGNMAWHLCAIGMIVVILTMVIGFVLA